MRPTTILSLTVAAATHSASASNIHEVADLIARAMDPATMDPTKFSVLSVLRTAMPSPTGTVTDIALPTGNIAPQWYKDLPADVMVLLAQMYPATPTAVVSETASLASSGSSSSIQDSTASQATLTNSPEAASITQSASAWGTGYSNGSVIVSTGSLSPNVTSITDERSATASGTGVPTGKPGLELPSTSAGAKKTIGTGSVSVAIGLTVAAVFCLFA
ncbi:hypothetical protein E8E12_007825 [Didymella heteroderae]|uniref:Uncharacterized protein n=1 Tax=Didymella heteroderae TaxID=1769908 RepID=A0A9P4WS99_9PLEO|nr:hypothetical protein E8E12_007825 [Didymella heteroderae]